MSKRGDHLNYGLLADIDLIIIYILLGVTLLLLLWTYITAKDVDRLIKERPELTELEVKLKRLSRRYTVMLTLISIFPLLGMLGTVFALLDLDITGASAQMKNDFFHALNTTAAGLIAAVITKVANSFVQAYIERQEEHAKDHLEKRLY